MLEGITVLSQTEIEYASILWIIIPMFVVAIGVIIIGTKAGFGDWIVVLGFGVGFVIGMFCFDFAQEPTGEYEYECVIEESVSMTEFYERYDVIDQRGKIYKIKEKSND